MPPIPHRVLLDTNIVNFILDHDGCIFENEAVPGDLREQDVRDIHALRGVFMVGERAHWEMAISPATYREVWATPDVHRRARLKSLLDQFWEPWRDTFDEDLDLDDGHAFDLARRFEQAEFLKVFPDATDRELLAHAVAYGCDAMCTRDRRSILKRLDRAPNLPLSVLSPEDWWQLLLPHLKYGF